MIVSQAKKIVPLLISLIFSIRLTIFSISHISYTILTKLVAIFIIMCRLAHQNNSNYIPFFILPYLYSVNIQVDAITFLNYLGISILYTVFMRKLRGITTSSITFIKE